MNAVENIGFHIGHAHDDLAFTEENVFLLKMEKSSEQVSLYFNSDCDTKTANALELKLCAAAKEEGLRFTRKGTYTLTQSDKNAIAIDFNES